MMDTHRHHISASLQASLGPAYLEIIDLLEQDKPLRAADIYAFTSEDLTNHHSDLRKAFAQAGDPDVTKAKMDQFIAHRLETIKANTANAKLERPQNAGDQASCIITTSFWDASHQKSMTLPQYLESFTAFANPIDPEDLDNMPGTTKDWSNFLMLHETGHCIYIRDEGYETGNEIQADRFAEFSYNYLVSKGHDLNPETPEAFTAIRQVAVMKNGLLPPELQRKMRFDEYEGAGLYAPDDPNMPSPVTIQRGVRSAIEKVAEKLGLDYTGDINKDKQIYANIDPSSKDIYDTVKELQKEEAFKGNPVEEKFAEKFLESSEKYFPKTFKIVEANADKQQTLDQKESQTFDTKSGLEK